MSENYSKFPYINCYQVYNCSKTKQNHEFKPVLSKLIPNFLIKSRKIDALELNLNKIKESNYIQKFKKEKIPNKNKFKKKVEIDKNLLIKEDVVIFDSKYTNLKTNSLIDNKNIKAKKVIPYQIINKKIKILYKIGVNRNKILFLKENISKGDFILTNYIVNINLKINTFLRDKVEKYLEDVIVVRNLEIWKEDKLNYNI